MSFPTDSSRQSMSVGGKPRLVRQSAFQDESQEPSSPRLNVRFLPTIPSAPDSSVQLDDEPEESPSTAAAESPSKSDPVTLKIPASESSDISSPKINSKPP